MGRSNSARPPTSRNGSNTAVTATNSKAKNIAKRNDYGSDGVEDNDVFLLPASDFLVLALVTVIGAAVRLFRIYQPTSVVFDEVQ